MEIKSLHPWQVTRAEARRIQNDLAGLIRRSGDIARPRLIAGADVAVGRLRNNGTAAVVVLNYPEMEPVEFQTVSEPVAFPYVPGLLSFREAPLVLSACKRLRTTPDVMMVDGQGLAHPRRMGLACHIGLLLDIPTIGCAKSRLLGDYREPGDAAGCSSELIDDGEIVGAALRTRTGTRPVFVSIGHKIDLAAAVRLVLDCCHGYRIPEPLRLAHQFAGGHTILKKSIPVFPRELKT